MSLLPVSPKFPLLTEGKLLKAPGSQHPKSPSHPSAPYWPAAICSGTQGRAESPVRKANPALKDSHLTHCLAPSGLFFSMSNYFMITRFHAHYPTFQECGNVQSEIWSVLLPSENDRCSLSGYIHIFSIRTIHFNFFFFFSLCVYVCWN